MSLILLSAMRLPRFGIVAFVTFLIVVILNVDVRFPSRLLGRGLDWQLIQPSQVLAQTMEERKAEADRLLDQGIEQLNTSQFEAALQSWQQALIIYQEINDRKGEGKALGSLGIAYDALGDYTQAIKYQQQSLAIAREIQYRRGEGAALGNLGLAYDALGDYIQAIEYHQQTLVITREIQDRRGEGNALGNLGSAYASLGDYSQAIEYQRQKLAIARELNDRRGEGAALGSLGSAYSSLEDYTQAIDYLQQFLAIAREIKDRRGEGIALGSLGLAYYSLGNYTQAIEYHQQTLAIAREINDRRGEGIALGNLGSAYNALGDYTQAIEYQQQSLAIAREINDRRGEGKSLGNLGNAYASLGDYTQAIEYQQQHLVIAREINDRRGEGNALGNLGSAYNALGDYTQAIEYQQQSLAIAREINDRRGEGIALGNLGSAYNALGDYSQAIEYQRQKLAIARELNDRRGEGAALGNLGSAYDALGDYSQAIEYQRQKLAIAREINDRRGEGDALGNLGNTYLSLGDYTQAIEYYQQSLAIAREIKNRRGEGDALGNLGNTYLSLGDYTQAIEYYQQSLAIAREINDRRGEGDALGNLGLAYLSLGDYTQAIEYHQQHLVIAREIKNRSGEGIALNNLGLALFNSGNLVAAEQTLLDGITVWESLRSGLGSNDAFKVSIFEQQARTYRTLQKVLIAQNKTDTALEIAERGRARAFVELLQQRLLAADSVTDGVSRNSDNPTSATSVIPSIATIKQIAQQQNATLVEYSIIYDEFKINGKQEWKESELYIWVIQPTGEITFRQADLKPLWQQQDISLTDLVYISRNSIGVRGRGGGIAVSLDDSNPTQKLRQLHQLLIEPIADLLPTNPNAPVIFLPQESLFLVPFTALQDASGQSLIEQHTILTAPAIQVLDLTHEMGTRNRNQETGNTLIVGNPTMPKVVLKIGEPPQQLSSLPGAEKEAQEIAQLLNTNALIGNQATKTAVVEQMKNARIIHLATHGLLDDFKGLGIPGAIVLAPNPTSSLTQREEIRGNGLLTADEIFDLKLNAELVVLSACDTGQGRVTGDGVIGLSRSLISAGVPSVVVSLWSVSDDSTAFLMTEFYQNLQQNIDKAQALRLAMLKTKERYPNPLYWAAFTLIGESE